MAPRIRGTLHTHVLADGTRAFHLRVPYRGERPRIVLHEHESCECGCGGGWDEPAARNELGNILARIRVGVWKPPTPPTPLAKPADGGPQAVETFRVYAEWWLEAKILGSIGEKPIAPSTELDYRWRLSHLLRFFGRYRLDQIDYDLCQRFKTHKLREAREIRDALAAGANLRTRHNSRMRPLSASSLRRLIMTLNAILDEAVDDAKIPVNPARGRRMRIKVPKPRRTFLEIDELTVLLDAATRQDRPLQTVPDRGLGETARAVALLLLEGLRPWQIAERLNLTRGTVSWHTRRLGATVGHGYIGRQAVCCILGYSGVRATELCQLRIGQVRLHDQAGGRFRILDAKTETGIREVQMTPRLTAVVIEHIDRLRRAGHPTGPDDFLVQNITGGQLTRQRVAAIVREAAIEADQQLAARGRPPLQAVTPHSLRRTYISIALLANNFDVRWVMSQVGHADSKMTMDVYAQLEQRAERHHGTNFDQLLHRASTNLTTLTNDRASPETPQRSDQIPLRLIS